MKKQASSGVLLSILPKLLESCNYQCRRLPIPEFMLKKSGTFNVMLTINQVVEILCKYASSGNWKESLGLVVPKRTGYIVDDLSITNKSLN